MGARKAVSTSQDPQTAMYNTYIMKRTQIYLDDEHDRRLSERADAAGTTKSALIREAIDAYLAEPASGAAWLARSR